MHIIMRKDVNSIIGPLVVSIIQLIICCLAVTSPSLVSATLTPSQMTMLQTFFASTGGAAKWSVFQGWDLDPTAWVDPCDSTNPTPKLFGVSCLNGAVQVLNLQANNLDGVIPPGFFEMFPTITTVQLLNNPLLGGPMPSFGEGSMLEVLILSECAFNGTIPASVFTGPLRQLLLQGNQLTGALPDEVSNSRLLTELNLGSNSLSIGAMSSAVVNCSQLSILDLTACQVTSVPLNLDLLGGLKQLELGQNSLSGTIPTSWCNFLLLTDISLSDNSGLTGSIPDCLRNWTLLNSLVIENTQMEGTIPTFIFTAFPGLTDLYLSGSKFGGVIPDMFDRIPMLQHAEFNGNNKKGDPTYSGAFPNTLLGLTHLQSLSIQYTQIEGMNRTMGSLKSLQTLTLISNPLMTLSFPTELLLAYWTNPAPAHVVRTLMLTNIPMTGTLPVLSPHETIYNVTGGVSFAFTDVTGYIPNATLDWVPQAQQENLLEGCSKLLSPVGSWMFGLTKRFEGMVFTLDSITDTTGADGSNVFPMSGGTMFGIRGSNYVDIPSRLYCGFCISGDASTCASNVNAMSAAVRSANLAFTPANQTLPGVMFCATPQVVRNWTINVYMFYIGPAYANDTEYYLISSNAISVSFYDPTPLLYALQPNHGRIEGCTTVYAHGSGFTHAPNMTLRISGAIDIWIFGGVVLNDSVVKFVLPSANVSAVNTKYRTYSDTPLEVDMFAAGSTVSAAVSNATYTFTATCTTPLVPCQHGFTDDQECPIQPLCRCFSEGQCLVPNGSVTYDCICAPGFSGHGCGSCDVDYYGPSCQKCDCGHGTCDDGMVGSGACTCESDYTGTHCSISKWGLGFGIPFAIVILVAIGLLIRKKYVDRLLDDPDYGMPMNSLRT